LAVARELGEGGRNRKGRKEGQQRKGDDVDVIAMFFILNVEKISQVKVKSKLTKLYTLNMFSLLHIKYTLIKMFLKILILISRQQRIYIAVAFLQKFSQQLGT
jgi:hypothetical protein